MRSVKALTWHWPAPTPYLIGGAALVSAATSGALPT